MLAYDRFQIQKFSCDAMQWTFYTNLQKSGACGSLNVYEIVWKTLDFSYILVLEFKWPFSDNENISDNEKKICTLRTGFSHPKNWKLKRNDVNLKNAVSKKEPD